MEVLHIYDFYFLHNDYVDDRCLLYCQQNFEHRLWNGKKQLFFNRYGSF